MGVCKDRVCGYLIYRKEDAEEIEFMKKKQAPREGRSRQLKSSAPGKVGQRQVARHSFRLSYATSNVGGRCWREEAGTRVEGGSAKVFESLICLVVPFSLCWLWSVFCGPGRGR